MQTVSVNYVDSWISNVCLQFCAVLPVIFVVSEYWSSLLQDRVNQHLCPECYNCSRKNTFHSYLKMFVLEKKKNYLTKQKSSKGVIKTSRISWSYPVIRNEQQSMTRLAVKELWGRVTSVHFKTATNNTFMKCNFKKKGVILLPDNNASNTT